MSISLVIASIWEFPASMEPLSGESGMRCVRIHPEEIERSFNGATLRREWNDFPTGTGVFIQRQLQWSHSPERVECRLLGYGLDVGGCVLQWSHSPERVEWGLFARLQQEFLDLLQWSHSPERVECIYQEP